MPDDLDQLMMSQTPTAERPLQGVTVLIVEDSLYACEAMRLLCLRSGARIRRADSLKSAHRHLSVFHPMVVIVDLGLPDGSGADLIHELANASPRVGVILGISGDLGAQDIAQNAGADGFLAKPIDNLATFQSAVLAHLPAEKHPRGPRRIDTTSIAPDPLALQDDLLNIRELLGDAKLDQEALAYVAQFLTGVARLARDQPLEDAALKLDANCRAGQQTGDDLNRISELVGARLQGRAVV